MKTNKSLIAMSVIALAALAACGDNRNATTSAIDSNRNAMNNTSPNSTPSGMANTAATKIDNAAITAAVNVDLAKDPDLSALKINVDTTQAGAVSLRGTAPTAMAKEKATTIAKAVSGVTSVDNQLTVGEYSAMSSTTTNGTVSSNVSAAANSTGEALKEAGRDIKEATANAAAKTEAKLDDASITVAINAGLAKDADLSAVRINVDTKNGNVTLNGPAPTLAAKNKASDIAKGVNGVKAVNNQLTVNNS